MHMHVYAAETSLSSLWLSSSSVVDDVSQEMILKHSAGTSLVIVNLPDPPELGARTDSCSAEELDYMHYMEGMAEHLPRVMYVHGSGQEVINFAT